MRVWLFFALPLPLPMSLKHAQLWQEGKDNPATNILDGNGNAEKGRRKEGKGARELGGQMWRQTVSGMTIEKITIIQLRDSTS